MAIDSIASAEMLYTRALKIDPESPDAYYNLACAQARMGNDASAIESLRRAILYGFNQPELMTRDTDLQSLQKKSGFKELLAFYFPDFAPR